MSFTAVFIALLLERFIIFNATPFRSWSWFEPYQRMIKEKLQGQTVYALIAAYTLPIILVVALIAVLLDSLIFGFLKLLFSLVVILYCFGPRNLWVDITTCLQGFSEGDSVSFADKLKQAFGISSDNDTQSLHRQLVARIFVQSNTRIFAIMFWYGIAGLIGVVFYRMVTLLAVEKGSDDTSIEVSAKARQIVGFMEWPTVRALSFLFALGGNFNRVFSHWKSKVALGPESNEPMLLECGMAALNSATQEALPEDGSAEKEAVMVIDRALVITLVVLAVLVFLIP